MLRLSGVARPIRDALTPYGLDGPGMRADVAVDLAGEMGGGVVSDWCGERSRGPRTCTAEGDTFVFPCDHPRPFFRSHKGFLRCRLMHSFAIRSALGKGDVSV